MKQLPSQDLPKSLYAFLACVSALIGLASSVVTAKFFILGLDRIETDALARDALITAGVLMVITELAAFGMAALLPRLTLRSLRVHLIICGVFLLSFETVTIYVTQVTLAQNAVSVSQGSLTKITELRAAIASNKLAADSLRDNGTSQTMSSNSWTRQMGAAALRDSLATTRLSQPLVLELAKLESEQRSTLVDILGSRGMIMYSVARALLISAMGLVMFAAAGALLRSAINKPSIRPAGAPVNLCIEPNAPSPALRAFALQGLAPHSNADFSYQSQGLVVSEMFNLNALPTNPKYSSQHAYLEAHKHTQSTAASALSTKSTVDTESTVLQIQRLNFVGFESDTRFKAILDEVSSARVKPTVRSLQIFLGIGTLLARKYLRQLESMGVITPFGKGWALKLESN